MPDGTTHGLPKLEAVASCVLVWLCRTFTGLCLCACAGGVAETTASGTGAAADQCWCLTCCSMLLRTGCSAGPCAPTSTPASCTAHVRAPLLRQCGLQAVRTAARSADLPVSSLDGGAMRGAARCAVCWSFAHRRICGTRGTLCRLDPGCRSACLSHVCCGRAVRGPFVASSRGCTWAAAAGCAD